MTYIIKESYSRLVPLLLEGLECLVMECLPVTLEFLVRSLETQADTEGHVSS